MSRSGDECVVALTDQWYLLYGEAEWQALTARALAALETFSHDAHHAFEHCLGAWLAGLRGIVRAACGPILRWWRLAVT